MKIGRGSAFITVDILSLDKPVFETCNTLTANIFSFHLMTKQKLYCLPCLKTIFNLFIENPLIKAK